MFKSSRVLPGGCSLRSHPCMMRSQGKSDSWSPTAPQTPGGWGSLVTSSGVAQGDLHWAQSHGEDECLLQRRSKGYKGLVPSRNGGPQLLQVLSGTVWFWQLL